MRRFPRDAIRKRFSANAPARRTPFSAFYRFIQFGACACLGARSAPLVSRQAHAPKPRLRVKHGLVRIFKCRNFGCIQHKKREFYNSLKLCFWLYAATFSAFVKVCNGFIKIVRVVSVIPKVISVFFAR